jgi:hypothetical protein
MAETDGQRRGREEGMVEHIIRRDAFCALPAPDAEVLWGVGQDNCQAEESIRSRIFLWLVRS